jgi:hypothetical protein
MTEAFVPLSPATFSGRGTPSPAAAPVPPPPLPSFDLPKPAANLCAEPSVSLQRNGDAVTGIRVQCGCGQVIELNCQY